MDILVIGGSYFLGKCFLSLSSGENNVTVLNRGNVTLDMPCVTFIQGDRHDAKSYEKLENRHFDAIVDFCGYQEGDIKFVFEGLRGRFDQYIFISTVDVYKRGLGRVLDENAPYETRNFGGDAGAYILGKVALELELMECARNAGVYYTILRPSFIYGPGNYAPREGMYFEWIEKAKKIIHPKDATGRFQMVYVEDVANAALCSIGNDKALNRAFNLAPKPFIDYEAFANCLKEVSATEFEIINLSVKEVNERQIPLPFPLTEEETNLYDGELILDIIGEYTEFYDGMKKTL